MRLRNQAGWGFNAFHFLTFWATGPQRARIFDSLPGWAQRVCWSGTRRAAGRGR
jgi:hypothetical protein